LWNRRVEADPLWRRMSLDELTPWLLLANLLLVAGVLLIALRRGGGSAALGGQGDLERLHEKQAAQIDQSRRDLLEAVARSQSTLQNEVHGVQRAMLEDGGKLRTDLMERFEQLSKSTHDQLSDGKLVQQRSLAELKQSIEAGLANHRQSFEQRQGDALKAQQEALTKGMSEVSRQVGEALGRSAEQLSKRVEGLAETTDKRLKEISGQVEQRLAKGFEKTTETFSQVLQHLTRIDEAQKKITELSSNVVSLQEVLTDKRSRGAFGEVQLAGLVRNVMPEGSFELQKTLSNGTRVDCLLTLPDPSGNVAIDAKFPLESYKRLVDPELAESERRQAGRQFVQDIKKHIRDISEKYLIPGETSEGAVMFLPAESIFAEIHAHFPELVEEAQRARVWLVSPTTLMAVLTTARAVLKDEATRKQVHIIQDHLHSLSEDFGRFQQRMDKLSTRIRQAHDDVDQVNISARKISTRFERIERVELALENDPTRLDADAELLEDPE
jgi:DNA recombination protein RmuC